jgi:uncharacterized protein
LRERVGVGPDPDGAADFYAELFGWQTENLMPADFPWVADADAAAARAGAMDGAAVMAPHDTPGFRRAVLADPAGAVFSVSKLVVAA